MIRTRLRAVGLALLLASAAPAALAQQASTAAPALPAPLTPIPAARDVAYPGRRLRRLTPGSGERDFRSPIGRTA